MSIAATVLVPTFDHGPLLRRALAAICAQTVREIEIFVVGDGVPEATREWMHEVTRDDSRIRFFDNEKGQRHGEAHRHAALANADSKIVCMACDDDLLLPDHVATMLDLLANADIAHTLPVQIGADGRLFSWPVDWRLREFRDELLRDGNRVPSSNVAFSLATYRQLPVGWSPAPLDVPTDVFMWRKFFALDGLRVAASNRPTVLHFPSPARQSWSMEKRTAELDAWLPKVLDRTETAAIEREAHAQIVAQAAQLQAQSLASRTQTAALNAELDRLRHTIGNVHRALNAGRAGAIVERPVDLGELARYPINLSAGRVVAAHGGVLEIEIVGDDFFFELPGPFLKPGDGEFHAVRMTVTGPVGTHFSLYAANASRAFSENWVTHAPYAASDSPTTIELRAPVAPDGALPTRFRLDCFNGPNPSGRVRILGMSIVVAPFI